MLNKIVLEKKSAKVATRLGLSHSEVGSMMAIAHQVYQEIGADLPPDNKKRGTCRRSTILECVIDANRLESQLKQQGLMTGAMDQVFKSHLPGDLEALIGPAFAYAEYEVSGENV